jgi:hypothetical protein
VRLAEALAMVAGLGAITGCAVAGKRTVAAFATAPDAGCAPDTLAVVHTYRSVLIRFNRRTARDSVDGFVFTRYLPVRDTNAIRLVVDGSVCAHAAAVYSADTRDSTRALRRRVTVVQAGDRFIITDPFTPVMGGEWATELITDRRWKVLVRLGR